MIKIKDIVTPFGKAGNIYLIGALTQGISPILLTPFLTRAISTTEFGQIAVLNSIAIICSIILTFGVPIVISRSYILEKNNKSYLDKLVNRLIFSYIFASILTFLAFKYSRASFLIFISISFLFAVYQIGLPTFRARNRPLLFAVYSILNTLLPTLLIILFLNIDFDIYDLFFLGSLISSIFALIFIYRKSYKKISEKYIFKTFKSALPIIPHMLGMIAFVNIDKVLFGYLKNETLAGFLQIIMLVGLSPIFILSALNHAWLNQILEQLKKLNTKTLDQINKTVQNLQIICSLIIVFIFITTSKIIEILNPNLNINSNILSSVFLTSISSLLYVTYLANTHILTWSRNFWILGISTPLSVLIQGLCIYFLIDKVNYLSAAIGIGAALTLQLIILELFNTYKKNNRILMTRYKLLPIIIYWFFCFFIVI